jgi:predicted nucleic acid-binding protein
MVAELTEVLNRPRLREKYQLDPVAISELIEFLTEICHDVVIVGDVRICRDPDDDMLIETATKGSADVLVSRDEDLTRAVDVISALDSLGIQTLTVARFLALLEARETGDSI